MKNPLSTLRYKLEGKYRVHTIYILIIAIHWIYGYAYFTCKNFYIEYVRADDTVSIGYIKKEEKPTLVPGSDEWIKEQWMTNTDAKWEHIWATMQGESGWNEEAWNCNNNGSLDLGIYQLNMDKKNENKALTPSVAIDRIKSTEYAIEMYNRRGLQPWIAAKKLGLVK